MHLGVDLGSTQVKTSKGIRFLSGVKTDTIDLQGGITVEFEGRKVVTGQFDDQSEKNNDINKRFNDNILVNFYAALAMSTDQSEDEFEVVIGYPISQYKENKIAFKEMLMRKPEMLVSVGGKTKTLHIKNIEVFPEGAGAFYCQGILSNEPTLIIDVGGLTVNWGYFVDQCLVAYDTYKKGMMTLYQALAAKLNSKYGSMESEGALYTTMKHGFYDQGKKVDLSMFLSEDLHKYVKAIIDSMSIRQDVNRAKNVVWIGGGIEQLEKAIYEAVPHSRVMQNSVLFNAQGFEEVAKRRFK